MLDEETLISQFPSRQPPERGGVVTVGDRDYMTDPRGALVPLGTIKAQDKLIDETVRKIMGFAADLSAQVARFKGHTFDDIGSLQALLDQEYGAKAGGPKGNVTLTTFDGLQRVTLKMADLIEFGPELQAAKKLVDECLNDWSADAAMNSGPSSTGPSRSTAKAGSIAPKSSCCCAPRSMIRAGSGPWTLFGIRSA